MMARKIASALFLFLLFSTPLFYYPTFLFADSVKACWVAVWLALVLLLGPLQHWLSEGSCRFPVGSIPFFLLLFFSALSLLWGRSLAFGLTGFAALMLGMGITISAIYLMGQRLKLVLSVSLVSGTLAALYGLLQSFGFDFFGIPPEISARSVSTFGNTNYASEFCAPLVAIALVFAVREAGLRSRLANIAIFLLCAYLSTVHVRAGMISACAGLLLGSLLFARTVQARTRWKLLTPLLAALLGLLAPKFIANDRNPAAAQKAVDTIEVRKKIYSSTLEMSWKKPISGWGIGQFAVEYPPFREPEEILLSSQNRKNPNESAVREPHNDYLLFGTELGIAGLILLAWFGWSILRCWKAASHSPEASAAFAAIGALAVNALFRSPWTNPSSHLLFWSLLAVLSVATDRRVLVSGKKWLAGAALALFLAIGYFATQSFFAQWQMALFFKNPNPENLHLLESSTQRYPWDDRSWDILAAYRRDLGKDTAGAEKAYESLLALHPNHFGATLNLGLLRMNRGEHAGAGDLFQKAEKLDAKNPKLLRALARLSLREGNDFEAIRQLEEETRNFGSQNALREIGAEIERAGDAARALKYYNVQVRLHPDDADSWYAMGQIFRNQGDSEEADPLFSRARRLYGIEHLLAGRISDAEKQFRLYQQKAEPNDPLPALYFAACKLAGSKRDEAAAAMRELAQRGVKQEALRERGLEKLAADPELRGLLAP